jgi:DNA repair protein RadC
MSHGIRIKDLPKNERPRERLVELGADALKTSELIAILLRTGLQGVSAIEIGEKLLQRFGTLTALERATLDQLQETKGIGRDKAIALKSSFTLARRMASELHGEAPVLDTPHAVADYLREQNRGYEVEHFQSVLLNARRKLIRVETISQGLVDTILVHPARGFQRGDRSQRLIPGAGP